MNDQASKPDLSSLESRLAGVQRDLAAAAAGAAKRRVVSLVVLVIIVVAMIIYLSVITSMVKKEATIENLAYIVEAKLDAVIDDQSRNLIQMAKDKAPELAKELETRALAAPAQITQQLRTMAKDGIKEQIDAVEPQLISALKEMIEKVYAEASGEDGKRMTEDEWQAFLKDVGEITIKRTKEAIAEARRLYLTGGDLGTGAGQFLNYMELLAGDEANLTERQKHHARLFTRTLEVLEKYQTEAEAGASSL